MTKTINAVYEQGVFRPLEPVRLPDHQEVRLIYEEEINREETISDLDLDFHAYAGNQAAHAVSLETVRELLAKIPGSLTNDFIAEREER